MNASYKIALVVAVGLLIVVAGYYATRNTDTPQPVSDVSNADDADQATPATDTVASADQPNKPPTQRQAPTAGERTPPAVRQPTTSRDDSPAQRPGPRTASSLPAPPEADPADAATTQPPVVNLGPGPARLPRSLADARNPGTTVTPDATPETPATERPSTTPVETPAEETVTDAGPSETPAVETTDATPIDATPTPAQQPDTPATVDATPQPDAAPDAQPGPAERPTFPSRPAERAADTSGIPATYTIAAGDMLVKIAERFYGTQAAWEAIAQANPTVDPTRLRVGDVLRLPRPDAVDRPRTEPPAPTPGRRDAYTVQAGDNLYRIAQRFYNDAEKWDVIYNHNRDTIGDDPAKLREGMTLVIPPAVGGAQ